MSAEGAAVVGPRTTGELLDDAWRLYIADAPALLLLSGAFLAPAFGALVLLAGLPAPANPALRLLPPLLPLALLVLTGIGSGACQEWLRARAERRKPTPAGCLAAAFRRGLPHAAARALALVGPLLGLGVWLSTVSLTEKPGGTADPGLLLWRLLITAVACLPGLLLWPFTATIHAFLASGKNRSLTDLGPYFRQAGADTGKGGVVTLTRAAMLLLVVVNLVLLVEIGLWVLDGIAGLDAAFVGLQLSIANPVYDLALVLFAWLLLAPFFEASNFLWHVDARSRHEGLDLQVRVQRVFPTAERQRVGALAVLVGLLCLAAPARADTTYDAVHAARQDVQAVRQKAGEQNPYRGGLWQDALDQTADRLERAGGRQRFAWFRKAIDGFADRAKDDALRVLDGLDERLALLEEALPHGDANRQTAPSDDFKKLLQQSGGRRPAVQPEDDTDQKKPDDDKEKKKDDDEKDKNKDDPDNPHGHPALMGPGAVPGCGQVGLVLAAGLALAVLLVGVVMFIAGARRDRRLPGSRWSPRNPSSTRPSAAIRCRSSVPPPSGSARPTRWPARGNIWRRYGRSTWRCCRCCTGGSCCASSRRGPTANTSSRCVWRRRPRPPCTPSLRSLPACLRGNGTATAPARRRSTGPPGSWRRRFRRWCGKCRGGGSMNCFW